MNLPDPLAQRIRTYLDDVQRHLAGRPETVRADLRRQIESHICEALRQRAGETPSLADLEAVLSEMDPPDSFAAAAAADQPPTPSAAPQNKRPTSTEIRWFILACLFLALNGWAVWRHLPPESHATAGGPSEPVAATPAASAQPATPLQFTGVSQASYDAANRSAVLRLSFTAAPAAAQLDRFLSIERESGPTNTALQWQPVGTVSSPALLLRAKGPIAPGDRLFVTVRRGLTGGSGHSGQVNDTTFMVIVGCTFTVEALSPESPSFGPCFVNVGLGRELSLSGTDGETAGPDAPITVRPPVKFEIAANHQGCTLTGPFQPGTNYIFTFRKGLKAVDGSTLPEDVSRDAVFPNRHAALSLACEGTYLSPRGSLNVPVLAMNVKGCKLAVRRVRPENAVFFFNDHSARYRGLARLSDPPRTNVFLLPDQPNREHKFYVNLRDAAGERSSGVYEISADAIRSSERADDDDSYSYDCARQLVVVTDLAISAKRGRDGVWAWINSLRDGKPATNAEVCLYAANNMEWSRGRSDAQGLVFLPCPADPPREQVPTLVTARLGDDLTCLRVAGGCAGSDAYLTDGCEAFLFTDRGVYRPGETVHIEALVRDARLAPPAPFPVLLRILKPGGQVFREIAATLSTRGAVEFAPELPAYLPTGRYHLMLTLPGTGRVLGNVTVAMEDFVPPQIAVTLDKLPERLRLSDPLIARVASRHLFGRPADGLPVTASVYLRDVPFKPAGYADYSFGDSEKPPLKRTIHLGESHLDRDGRIAFTNDPPARAQPAAALQATVCASVRDSGGRAVSAYGSCAYDAYPFYIGLKPQKGNWAPVGAPSTIALAVVAPDGKSCQPDAPLLASVERVEWNSVLRRDDGHYAWQSQRSKRRAMDPQKIVLTNGVGAFAFTPANPGELLVTVSDPFSGASSSCLLTASTSEGGWVDGARDKAAELQLTLDRASYAPGDQATLTVRAPFSGTALLTLETDRVLTSRVVTLTGNTASLTLAVTSNLFPNAHVVMSVIRPAVAESVWSAHRASGSVLLNVTPPGHRLTIQADAPSRARPQAPLAVHVRVLDESGAPAAGAEVTGLAVDEGICTLTDYATPDPLAFFLRPRSLGVTTTDVYADLIAICDDTSDATVSHVAGDAGAVLGRRLNPIRATRFRPVALWRSGMLTDTNGEATLLFDVPEFAGELRVTAVAFTGTAFGAVKRPVTVKRSLVVHAELPRFLAPGDTSQLALACFNETNTATEARWRVTCGGPLGADRAEGRLPLAANGAGTARVCLRAGAVPGKALCAVEVENETERYAETFELAVRPAVGVETRCVSGMLKAGAHARIAAPKEWLDGTAYYEACVSPRPAARLGEAVNWLLRYPYGCCEQTTSSAFPLLYLADLANDARANAMATNAAVPYVESGIFRLLSMQRGSGGFAMWPDGLQEEAWVSTYATHFLVEAKKAGYAVPEDRLRDALTYLAAQLTLNPESARALDLSQRAYACQVLALGGRPEHGWNARLLERADELAASGRAHLAAALIADGRPRDAHRLLEGIDLGPAAQQPRVAHTLDVALALSVWLGLEPEGERVARLVKEIESLRPAGCAWWSTTHENALALLALGQRARLLPNDRAPFEGRLEPEGSNAVAFSSARDLRWSSGLPGAIPSLRLVNRGPGACWYSVRMEGVPTAREIGPVDAGLAVRRTFLDQDGKPLDVWKLRQGALAVVKLTLDSRGETVDNVVVEDLLPAGWEIENPSLATTKTLPWLAIETGWCIHRELRDDRVLLFTGSIGGTAEYAYTIRAVTPGRYALPPVRAEAMYAPEINSLNGAGTIEVTE